MILKLKQNGISGNLLKITEDFLSNRYQRVVQNGQSSSWIAVNAGVLQGSILGPMLVLVHNNDLSTGLHVCFFYKKKVYKKMSLKNPKTLRKC